MKIIEVKLIVEDINNLSNQNAIDDVKDMITQAFDKEAQYHVPRCKLILMEVKHK